ncbi:MAG: GNAT family N-acetyltransferase [Planctomycetaceae bacterium]
MSTTLSLPSLAQTQQNVCKKFETVVLNFGESVRYSPAWPVLDRAYRADQHAPFDLHPERIEAVLSLTEEWKDRPALIVYGRSGENAGVAVLIPKNVSTKKIPGFGIHCTLKGHRLAGNAFLGAGQTPEFRAALLREVLLQLEKQASQNLLIEDLDVTSSLWHTVHANVPGSWSDFFPQGLQPRHRLQFPLPDRNQYWSKFSTKTKSTFRRNIKRLGNFEVKRFTEPSQVPDFLEDAHRISLETWQTQQLGLRVKNDRRELDLFSSAAILEGFRSYILYQDAQPIAFIIGLQSHGTFLTSELGFDQKFARFSPGQVLLLKILEDLIEHQPPTTLDFGFGDAGYKSIFGTHVSSSADVWLMPRTLKSSAIRGWGQAARAFVKTSKKIVQKTGFAATLKKALRQAYRLRSNGAKMPGDEAGTSPSDDRTAND